MLDSLSFEELEALQSFLRSKPWKKYVEGRREALLCQLEADAGIDETNRARGQLRELKQFRSLLSGVGEELKKRNHPEDS